MHGLQSESIHGFVALVPMADTEIVQLQQEGYAYMRWSCSTRNEPCIRENLAYA